MSVTRYALIRLERGRKRAMLLDDGGKVFAYGTDAERERVDGILASYFAAGWKAADTRYLYENHEFDGYSCIVHGGLYGGNAVGPLKKHRASTPDTVAEASGENAPGPQNTETLIAGTLSDA